MFHPDEKDLADNQPKFDFQNIDVKLYLALKPLYKSTFEGWGCGDWGKADDETIAQLKAANLAITEFELSHGPLPEWAVARNWAYELVPGAQLCTKDGRRMGNAHVLRCAVNTKYGNSMRGKMLYDCITDAGSYISSMTENEITEAFYIGDWISDPKTLIARFGNRNEDYGLREEGEPDVS